MTRQVGIQNAPVLADTPLSHLAAEPEAVARTTAEHRLAREMHQVSPEAIAGVIQFYAAEQLGLWRDAAGARPLTTDGYRAIAEAVSDYLAKQLREHNTVPGRIRLEPLKEWAARHGYRVIEAAA